MGSGVCMLRWRHFRMGSYLLACFGYFEGGDLSATALKKEPGN